MSRRLARLTALAAVIALAAAVPACSTAQNSTALSPTSAPTGTSGATPAATVSNASTAAPAASSTQATAVPTVVPLATCQTAFGIAQPPTPKTLPASLTVSLPAGLGGELEAYTDEQAYMMLLAPRGWSCTAAYGADGSGGVSVYPAGERLPSARLAADSTAQAVIGSQTSACYTCGLGQACPVFSSAAKEFKSYLGHPCPTTRPTAEMVVRLRPGLAAFADPPGVGGDGNPSGGRYPANGVMTYYPHNDNGSWFETCTLPPADKDLCTAILDYFVTSYQSR